VAKIFAISGVAGSGKSTVLEELRNRGYFVDDYKVSRAVQQELGFTSLAEATKTLSDIKLFQKTVFNKKYERETFLHSSMGENDVILTERSFADISVYNELWFRRLLNKEGRITASEFFENVTSYSIKCNEYQKVYSGILHLPMMECVKYEVDPSRAPSELDEQTDTLLRAFICGKTPCLPYHIISKASVSDRADEIENFIHNVLLKEE